MTQNLLSVVALLASSTTLTALITAWAMRAKIRAETRKIDAETDVTASEAWKDLLVPYRDELRELRADVVSLGRENEALKTELKNAKQQIGILSRLERESTVESAVVKTKLAEHGIEIPVAMPPLARTREGDEYDASGEIVGQVARRTERRSP